MDLGWRGTLPFRAIAAAGVVLVLTAAAIAWADVVRTLQTARPVPVQSRPKAILWNDRVFESRPALARWLRSRGSSYAAWARVHPAASVVIDPSLRAASAARAASSARGQDTATPLRSASRGSGISSGSHVLRSLIVALSLAIGALCVVLVALPRLSAARRIWPTGPPAASYGSILFAVAAAIFVGLLISLALG